MAQPVIKCYLKFTMGYLQIIFKVLIILFMFGCSQADIPDPTIQELNFIAAKRRVNEYMKQNQPEKAEQHFDSLVYTNTKSYEYFLFAGDLKMENNKFMEGVNFYKKAANIYEDELICQKLAFVYNNYLHDSVNYILYIKKLLELNPKKADYYAAYAKHFANQQLYSVAIDYSNKALSLAAIKDLSDIYVMRSGFKFEFGDSEGATKDCDSAIILDNTNCMAYIQRTTWYLDSKRYKEAIQSANQGLKMKCDAGHLYFRRGLSKYGLDDILGAREDIIKSLELKNEEAVKFINFNADPKFRLLIPPKYRNVN